MPTFYVNYIYTYLFVNKDSLVRDSFIKPLNYSIYPTSLNYFNGINLAEALPALPCLTGA